MAQRLIEHYLEKDNPLSNSFTSLYNVIYLIYYEDYDYINDAITREKKDRLVDTTNPQRQFLNKELLGEWPPKDVFH